MSGRKRTPCEFCANEDWWTENGENQHQVSIEIYPDYQEMAIYSFALRKNGEMDEISARIEMNYCPKCGRKIE